MSTIRDLMIRLGVDADVEQGLSKAASAIDASEGKFKLAAVGVGAAVGGGLSKGLTDNMNIEAANDKLAAQLGATGPEAERLGKVAGNLYGDAYGDSLESVNEAIRSVVQNIGGMSKASDADLKSVTGTVMNLGKAFDQDIGATSRAVGKMLKTGLATDATQALDILTRGFQTGANEADDLLDTFSEYSTQFRVIGLSGEQAMGLLSQGLKAGARDADTVADALKEFAIRAIDGSDTTKHGFESLGLSSEVMAKKIAAGGPEAAKGLDQVLDSLRTIEDPVKRNAIAVELFGTKAEDMGEALFALDPSKAVAALGQVGGAATTMGNTLNDNANHKVEELKRGLEQMLQSAASSQGPLGTATAAVMAFGEPALSAAGDIGALATGFGGLAAKAGVAIGGVIGSFASMVASAAVSTATTIGSLAAQGAKWLWLGVQSLLHAAKVAAAWLIAMGPIGLIIAAVIAVVALIVANWDTIKAAIATAWEWIKGKTSAFWEWLKGIVKSAVDAVVNIFMNWSLPGLIIKHWDSIKNAAKAAWDWVVSKITSAVSGIISAIQGIAAIPGKVGAWFNEMKNAAVQKAVDLVNWIKGLPGKILSTLSNMGNILRSVGQNLLQGLWNGIVDFSGWLYGQITKFFGGIVDWVKRSLGIASPAKKMMPIGKFAMMGIDRGMQAMKSTLVGTASGIMGSVSDVFSDPLSPSFGVTSGGMSVATPMAGAPSYRHQGTSDASTGGGTVIQGDLILQFADDRDMYQKGSEFAAGLREYKRRGGSIPENG